MRAGLNVAATLGVALALVAAAPAYGQQTAPGEALKAGERACFGLTIPAKDLAAKPKGAVSEIFVELHRELLNGETLVTWGGVHLRQKGERRSSFVRDGCDKQPDGALKCSVACDGGSFFIAADGASAIRLRIDADGLRVRTCGSQLKQLGTALLTPAAIGGEIRLETRPAAHCRAPMARFEKLLQKEEEGVN